MLDERILILLIPIVVIDIVLKGLALWKSAKLAEKGWFIAILVFNTAGILPGVYLLLKRGK